VFVGTVTEHKAVLDEKTCKRDPKACGYTYTVAVEAVWKGDIAATLEVATGTGWGDCSIGKLHGKRWLFVGSGALHARMCSGTQPATNAMIDRIIKKLGDAHPPKQ
jgi:hypothetical protein